MVQIEGLRDAVSLKLDSSRRDVMRDEYGEFGLDVNWCIYGTVDQDCDIEELIERLFYCAALLISDRPDSPLSLMRNGESFYLFNSPTDLIIPFGYLKAFPGIRDAL